MRADDDLMVAHARGEPGAFDALVERHQRPLTGFLRQMLGDEALAEDAVIETLFKVHRAAAGYEPNERFKTWLYTVAYREGVSLLRRRNKGVGRHTQALGEGEAGVPCYRPAPDATLAQRQAIAAVEGVLAQLPEVQRAVFLLYYREGMATGDIADAVQIPSGSVRAYLSMARRAIRETLPDWVAGA